MEGSIGILVYFLFVVSILMLGWLVLYFARQRKTVSLRRSTNLALLSISVPQEEKEENQAGKKDEKEIISVMEQFLGSLSKLRDSGLSELLFGPLQIALEIANPHGDELTHFYVAVPKRFTATVEKQVYGFFPNALVERVPTDYNIFTPKGKAVGFSMALKKKSFLPFKTYQMLESDPLTNITNSLSRLDKEKEGASIQIIIRPASAKWRRKGINIARKMKQGKSLSDAQSNQLIDMLWKLLSVPEKHKDTSINQYRDKQEELRQLTPAEEELLKEIEQKALKPAFNANIRLMASAETKERAEEILSHLTESFAQFGLLRNEWIYP